VLEKTLILENNRGCGIEFIHFNVVLKVFEMFKKMFSLFAIACLACTFAACGGPGDAKKDENITERKPKVSDSAPTDDEGDDSVKSIME
jgi:hypothetical protein